jgi:CRISPR/Cas system CMR subunit Cmr6 (Cas7 group RAMP superfamily)
MTTAKNSTSTAFLSPHFSNYYGEEPDTKRFSNKPVFHIVCFAKKRIVYIARYAYIYTTEKNL